MRQPPSNPSDAAELERLEAAIRRARQQRAQFIRGLSQRSRQREMQRLCVQGRAIEAFCAEQPPFMHNYWLPFLARYVTRDTDHDALVGTAFEIPKSDAPAPVAADTDNHHANDTHDEAY